MERVLGSIDKVIIDPSAKTRAWCPICPLDPAAPVRRGHSLPDEGMDISTTDDERGQLMARRNLPATLAISRLVVAGVVVAMSVYIVDEREGACAAP